MQTVAFKIALHGISPMIWRRLIVSTDTSLAGLHFIIQISMDWEDADYSFHIYGKEFGATRQDVILSTDDQYEVLLRDFRLDVGDKLNYTHNLSTPLLCDIRIEAIANASQDHPPRVVKKLIQICKSLDRCFHSTIYTREWLGGLLRYYYREAA